ncbi:hypothetical protein ACQLQX_005630, partial [Klebsiella pneumoniae]
IIHQIQLIRGITVFSIAIENVMIHRSHYAEVKTGVTFSLYEPEHVVNRWKQQREILKSL